MSAPRRAPGRMLLIGGNEDPDDDDLRILPHLVKMAGGRRARVMVCSSPSTEQARKVRVYGKLLERIGVSEVLDAPLDTRADAEAHDFLEAAEAATAVFFTGGDQLRLTSIIGGTTFAEVLRRRLLKDRLVVAGTSAGAAAMGGTMLIAGPDGGTVRRSDVDLAPGLAFWPDAVVDTHFNQRGRVHRILTVFGQNPQVLGVGIDENTAIELEPGRRFTVLGACAVTVFDGRVSHTNAPEQADEEITTLTDARVHVLGTGYGFDLVTKRPIHADGTEIPALTRAGER
jgi:cyanophycinase